MKIIGTGSFVPGQTVDNEQFTSIVETSDEWIRTRTGIHTRRISDGEPTWYMGEMAARRALERAGIRPDEVDLILFTTITADYISPSMACLVQERLGIQNAIGFDLNAACTGFIFGLDVAHRYLTTGGAKTVLLISSESLSQATNWPDRSSCVLFGDGAGACVLRLGEETDLFACSLRCLGTGSQALYAKRERKSTPFFTDREAEYSFLPDAAPGTIVMNGKEVYKFAVKAMPEAVESVCRKAGITPQELSLIVPHQANVRIVETAAKNLGIEPERFYLNLDHCGNTSSASVPLALDEAVQEGRIRPGDKVCFVGFGAGLCEGAAVIQW